MNITSLNFNSYKPKVKNNPNFSGIKIPHFPDFILSSKNNQSPFFINMDYYQKNQAWADKMLDLSETVSVQIKQKKSFNEVLNTILDGVKKINHSKLYGQYRHAPNGFCILEKQPNRGIEYFSRYKDVMKSNHTNYIKPKSNKEYPEANTCEIQLFNLDGDSEAIQIDYGIYTNSLNQPLYDKCSNLELAEKEYNKLIQIKNPSLKQINKSCATINWLIAQESPFVNGSDSIAKLLTTAIYAAYNVKLSPPKKRISFLDGKVGEYKETKRKAPNKPIVEKTAYFVDTFMYPNLKEGEAAVRVRYEDIPECQTEYVRELFLENGEPAKYKESRECGYHSKTIKEYRMTENGWEKLPAKR